MVYYFDEFICISVMLPPNGIIEVLDFLIATDKSCG
jgi:hypothetical protein